jgi:O-antigen ligase
MMSPLPQRLEALLVPGALVVLVFATLTLGATPAWARATTELAVVVLLAVWLVAMALRGELNLRLPALVYPLLAIFLLACLQAFARLSVYPPATRKELWLLLAAGGLYLLLHNQLGSESRVESFVTVLLLFGFALAVFAVVQKLSFNGKIYWFWTPHMAGGEIFGPFINRNHYAAWVLMLTPLAWMKAARRQESGEARLFWGLALLVFGLSVMLSLSRAGTLLFLLSVPLYLLLGRPGRRSSRAAWGAALAVIVLAGAATVALDTGRLRTRWEALGKMFTESESVELYRVQMWRDTVPMVGDHLGLGSGLDTFGALSDSYRTFPSRARWAQTHNDYLQWLAETGLVGAALALWFLWTLGRTVAEKMRLAADSRARQLVLGAALGCLLVLLQSLADFPLRIPANALLFASLWALISAPATGTVHNQRPAAAPEPVAHAEFRVR